MGLNCTAPGWDLMLPVGHSVRVGFSITIWVAEFLYWSMIFVRLVFELRFEKEIVHLFTLII